MIQVQTMLNIADNSGAKKAMCIKVLGHTAQICLNWRCNCIAVKSATPGGKVKKGSVERAVIVRTRKELRRPDGSYIRFSDNAAVIIDEKHEPKGTRIFGR